MAQIIQLNRGHIEITAGRVTAESMSDASGTRALTERIGQMAYIVENVDADGGRLCLHDCASHADAVRLAHAARAEGWTEGPVVDRVEVQ